MKKFKQILFYGLLMVWAGGSFIGCGQMLLFDPKGPVGNSERFVIVAAFVLMMIVVIPVFVMTYLFSRKYRASNTKATYMPNWSVSPKIELVVWLVPVIIVICLGYLAWTRTELLDPYKPIDNGAKPVNIQVISMDWKWLFIYPDQNIAVVNQLVFPANVPLNFRITSDTVMTSFFIPQLGSQIYAMAGMQTRLHLLAAQPGTYIGHNQQFSGRGFSEMNFKAIATSGKEFKTWVEKIKQSNEKLDTSRYEQLAKPSQSHPITYFSSVKPGLFGDIIHKFNPNMHLAADIAETK